MIEKCLWCDEAEGTEECPRCKGRVCPEHMKEGRCIRCESFEVWEREEPVVAMELMRLDPKLHWDGGYRLMFRSMVERPEEDGFWWALKQSMGTTLCVGTADHWEGEIRPPHWPIIALLRIREWGLLGSPDPVFAGAGWTSACRTLEELTSPEASAIRAKLLQTLGPRTQETRAVHKNG